jgi:hypothetical protein
MQYYTFMLDNKSASYVVIVTPMFYWLYWLGSGDDGGNIQRCPRWLWTLHRQHWTFTPIEKTILQWSIWF